jgi:hypothetical protein
MERRALADNDVVKRNHLVFPLLIALLFLTSGCGRKTEPAADAHTPDAHKLAAEVERLKKENQQLRQSGSSSNPLTKLKQLASGEPSEAEMRQAIQDRLDMMNENVAKLRNTRPQEGDPMSAILALTGAVMGDTHYEIGAFKKISAEKANGRPGYMCDYMLQLRASGKSAAAVDKMLALGGELCTARFVKTNDRWVWIPQKDETDDD